MYCVIPIFIIGISTAVTSVKLKRSAKNMLGESSVNNNTRRNRVVSSNVLLALIIAYAVSYVPCFSYYVYVTLSNSGNDFNISCAVYALLFVNSCFNPIALFIMSRKYRRILSSFITCRKKNPYINRDTSVSSTVTILTRF